MRICLSRGGEKHGTARAAVVIFCYQRLGNIAVASASVGGPIGGRLFWARKAVVAIRASPLIVIQPHEAGALPGTTGDV